MLERLFLLIAAALVLSISPVAVHGQPFQGYPILTFTAFPQPPKQWSEPVLMVELGSFLKAKYPTVFGNINASSDIFFFNQIYNPFGNTVSMALNPATFNNGIQVFYFDKLVPLLESGAALGSSSYTVSNALVSENAAPLVTVSFPAFGVMYAGAGGTPTLSVTANFSPRRGKSVQITLVTQAGVPVATSPSPIVIAYPSLAGSFQLSSSIAGTANFTASVTGGTDGVLRYQIDSSTLDGNNATFMPAGLVQLVVTPPQTKTFANTISDTFSIQVPPDYLYSRFALTVALRGSPSGLTIKPATLSLTSKNASYSFTISGPVGSYTVGYTLTGSNAGDFASPQARTPAWVEPTMNVTVSTILDAYMITPFFSTDYGGAYSGNITVRIRRPPKNQVTFSISADDSYAVPSQIVFLPNSSTAATFILVARTTGVKIVTFALSGPSAGDYMTPPAKSWTVRQPNPFCAAHGSANAQACLALNGCRWNEALVLCSNRTLPIAISAIPLVFNHEPKHLTITLPTRVVAGLTIVLTATARLAFSPKTLVLGPGATNVSFSFTPKLKRYDGTVQQNYFLKLSGPDANVFAQQQAYVIIRPQIECQVTGPWSFYVVSGSDVFTVTCDTPADSTTTMTLFTNEVADALVFSPPVLTLLPGNFSANFSIPKANSIGLFHIGYTFGGPDAPRYAPIRMTPVKVKGSIRVELPPSFYVTGGILSPQYNLDLSAVPGKVITIELSVIDAVTAQPIPKASVSIIPTNITFNGTQRGLFQVLGIVPGHYAVNVSLKGDDLSKYTMPQPVLFDIQDPEDGSAFTARLRVGFQPVARCRVNVGRNSEFFQGQNPPDDVGNFCSVYKQTLPNSTFNCSSLATKLLCHTILETTGNLCVWHKESCHFLKTLQGNVTDVAIGSTFVLLLTKNKTVWSIGETTYGQLGHYNDFLSPVPINANISAIVAGTAHALALDDTGAVWAWGCNRDNQLGIGNFLKQTAIPRQLVFPRDSVTNLKANITCITAGTIFSGALSLTGNVFMWGSNSVGQLSFDPAVTATVVVPTFLDSKLFNGDSVIGLQCGEYHTMVATESNVYTFGSNAMGQLGRDGLDNFVPLPPIRFNTSQPFLAEPTYNGTIVGAFNCSTAGL